MRVTLLLCDAAQVQGGKLFVLGGGWNIALKRGDLPVPMALAINILVPWNATNERHKFVACLLTEDGEAVNSPDGKPVEIKGEFEMGRPPGIKPGTSLKAPMAIQVALPLALGAYKWELSVDGTVLAEESFTVMPASPIPSPA